MVSDAIISNNFDFSAVIYADDTCQKYIPFTCRCETGVAFFSLFICLVTVYCFVNSMIGLLYDLSN